MIVASYQAQALISQRPDYGRQIAAEWGRMQREERRSLNGCAIPRRSAMLRDVVSLVEEGLTPRQIAERTGLTLRGSHVYVLRAKLVLAGQA